VTSGVVGDFTSDSTRSPVMRTASVCVPPTSTPTRRPAPHGLVSLTLRCSPPPWSALCRAGLPRCRPRSAPSTPRTRLPWFWRVAPSAVCSFVNVVRPPQPAQLDALVPAQHAPPGLSWSSASRAA
jgi:hypothetical protein